VVDPYEKSSRSLSRPGLAPGKKRQASLGALTPQITGSKKLHSEERAAQLFAVRVHLPC